jgi:ribosomal protein S12 methylthiotransferase accessory factor
MLPGVSTGKPDGTGYGYDDPEALHWWRTATLANQPYLAPADDIPPTRRSDYPPFKSGDLREDILGCQAMVEGLGYEMLVLDQTRPDIGLPVVKVVVPGLRHFWARFGRGRLYDVPLKMGWLSEPTPEAELNPIPVFI